MEDEGRREEEENIPEEEDMWDDAPVSKYQSAALGS